MVWLGSVKNPIQFSKSSYKNPRPRPCFQFCSGLRFKLAFSSLRVHLDEDRNDLNPSLHFFISPVKVFPIFDEIFGGDGDFSRLGQKFVREEEDVERKNYEDPQNESPSISSSEVIRGS